VALFPKMYRGQICNLVDLQVFFDSSNLQLVGLRLQNVFNLFSICLWADLFSFKAL